MKSRFCFLPRAAVGMSAALLFALTASAGPLSLWWGGGSGDWLTATNWSSSDIAPIDQSFSGTAATFGRGAGGTITVGGDLALSVFYVPGLSSYTFALGGNDISFSDVFDIQAATTFDLSGGSSLFTVSAGYLYISSDVTFTNFELGSDQLRFGTSASFLNSTQLSHIIFSGYSLGGAAQIDASGYVTPLGVSLTAVPEPSTYAALAGVTALSLAIVWRRRGPARATTAG